jgi:hypothetical protein
MAQYSVQQVVATGCTDALVAFRLPLTEPGWEVTAIQKTVMIDKAEATLGSVLLQGRLRACYTVSGRPRGMSRHPAGGPRVWHAGLTGIWADAPFCVAIAVPAAEPDLAITVTDAYVTAQVVTPVLDGDGLFAALDDQSVLHLAVRLSRPTDLHTEPPGPPPPPAAPPPPPKRRGAGARFQSR